VDVLQPEKLNLTQPHHPLAATNALFVCKLMNETELDKEKLRRIQTDGASIMVACHNISTPSAIGVHCAIH